MNNFTELSPKAFIRAKTAVINTLLTVRRKSLHFNILIGCLLITSTSLAQNERDTVSLIPKKKSRFNRYFGQSTKDANDGKLLVTPFFLPGYSPDIKFTLAGGAIFSFKTNPADRALRRSSAPITVTYSSINSFIASSALTTYWLHDKLRVNALIQYRVTRDAYYGIGYQNAIHTSFPDSTNYWRSSFTFQVRPLWKLERNFFAGVSIDYSEYTLWGLNAHMQKDPYYLEYGPHIYNTGIGGILSYDSRDYPQNAYRGIYSTLIFTDYNEGFGGNTNYRALDFDNRFFIPLSAVKISTLAINLRSRDNWGQPPFTSLVGLGNFYDLRGIHYGQFRNLYQNYLITEYRHKIYNKGQPTRFGFVMWGGVGAIGGDFSESLFRQPLPDFGVGLRFEVQPRLNLRVDFGYAPPPAGNHTATYFNFLEAY